MTNTEAIEILRANYPDACYEQLREAVDIAIQALETQNITEDIISRQAAIDAICKACSMEEDYHKCDGYPETSTWCDELVALRALPSAQPAKPPKWVAEDRYVKNRFAVFPHCPQCNAEITTGQCYCMICGQHIDWSEDENDE